MDRQMDQQMEMGLLAAENIHKTYSRGVDDLEVLRGLDLRVEAGEALAILGASGSGKSTLLHILGTLDQPDKGVLRFQGQDLLAMSEEELAQFRSKEMGFIFQFHHLLNEFTALENVMMPCRVAGDDLKDAEKRSHELLEIMGLNERKNHYPQQLSGGELQRVAIARALVRQPKILFADEPTGNLDSQTSLKIQDLFFELQAKMGLTLIVVTHDLQFATRFPRVLRMKDGLWL